VSFPLALLVAAFSGFIALSYEIIWYRVYSFVSQSSPAAFGLLLGAYLLGLALGSLGSGWLCRREGAGAATLRTLAALLLVANLVSLLVAPGLGYYAAAVFAWRGAMGMVVVAAGLLGTTLPLVAHAGIRPDEQAGARLSYLYLANIAGSVAGSLTTGFVLFDWWPLGRVSEALALLGVALAAAVALASKPRSPVAPLAIAAVAMGAVVVASPRLHDGLYERLLWGSDWVKHPRLPEIVENRHGVIAVEHDGTVWGGGAYDGRFNTGLMNDRNWVVRAYGVAGMHPAPKNVLMIGLATGSWAQVIANMPGLERLTAIEINPGYVEIIGRHPEVSSLLKNPKFEVVIDDGRRWLRRHPGQRFDFIVMNTSYHYRAHSTNLLSTEFLQLARGHLNPGGVLFYNTTSSRDVFKTGSVTFPHALRFFNFLAVSDSPFSVDRERWGKALTAWKIDGTPVFDLSLDEQRARLDEVLHIADTVNGPSIEEGLEDRKGLLSTYADAHVITDDNMYSEWWSPLAP